MDGYEVCIDKWGWYFNVKYFFVIGENGEYYYFVVIGGFVEWLCGVKFYFFLFLMYIGRGGCDGEIGEFKEFLMWLIDFC